MDFRRINPFNYRLGGRFGLQYSPQEEVAIVDIKDPPSTANSLEGKIGNSPNGSSNGSIGAVTTNKGYELEANGTTIHDNPSNSTSGYFMAHLQTDDKDNLPVILINCLGPGNTSIRMLNLTRAQYETIMDELPSNWREHPIFTERGIDLSRHGGAIRAYSPQLLAAMMGHSKDPEDWYGALKEFHMPKPKPISQDPPTK